MRDIIFAGCAIGAIFTLLLALSDDGWIFFTISAILALVSVLMLENSRKKV